MTVTAIFVLIYGLLVALGGIAGYLKAGSVISLISGLIFGCLLLFTGWEIFRGRQRALYWALGFALALFVLFLIRYLGSYKMMPAGMMMLISAIVAVLVVLQKWQIDASDS